MKWTLFVFLIVTYSFHARSQTGYQYSWKYYTTGNTGILGDYAEAIWIDHDGDPYIAAYTPGWEEGGFSKYIQQDNRWINYSSQVDYWVEDLTIDNEGNVWMTGNAGPGVGGFQKFDGQSYNSLNYPNDRSEGVVEDSENRLWSLGEYYNLKYFNDINNSWTSVDFIGLGNNIRKDPTRTGTIWACSGYQVLRSDGIYNYSRTVDDFPELDPQSDVLSTVIPAPDGSTWVGSMESISGYSLLRMTACRMHRFPMLR